MSYKHPEAVVETSWVNEHLNDKSIRIAEVDYDPTANHSLGHIPGAVLLDWMKDMNDPLSRDILSKQQLQEVLGRIGVTAETKLVLYGGFNNWFAAFPYWILNYHGVENVVLMDGGRKKWIAEDRPVTKDVPSYSRTKFTVKTADENIMA
jgi:thiosulfate/3-mercaptopyruvate sulfurtransferase